VPPWRALWAERIGAAERWLLPGECLLCHERVAALAGDPLICPLCRARWRRLPRPQCHRCGQPIDAYTECRICPDWPAGFGGVESAVWLDERARPAVHLLKNHGWRRVAVDLASAMASLSPLAGRPALVPIPLGAARLKSRGYNQSAELARAIARRSGLVVASSCLVRIRETGTQTALTPEERDANLRDAFRTRAPVPKRAVLVDDVFTTGATLRSAATALLAGGAEAVSAVTFGRAELPLAAVSRTISLTR